MNLCRSCNEDFGSVRAFDAHRVGKHAYTAWEGDGGRRCLAPSEMLAQGFSRNLYGRWSTSELAPGRRSRQDLAA